MQLNNSENGKIAKIDRWNLVNCDVKIYENGALMAANRPQKNLSFRIDPDLSVMPDLELSLSDNILKVIYERLLQLYPELQGYQLSSDESNWLYELRPIRVSIDRQLALESIYENNALGQLFLAMRALVSEFMISSENTITVYLEEIYDTVEMPHRQILEMFPYEIIIEEINNQ